MIDILLISASVSVVILLMLVITPLTKRRYGAVWRYAVWILLAVRLLIPVRFEPPLVPMLPETLSSEVAIPEPDTAPEQVNPVDNGAYTPSEGEPHMPDVQNDTHTAAVNAVKHVDWEAAAFVIWAAAAAAFFLWHVVSYAVFLRRIKPYLVKMRDNIYSCEPLESPVLIGFFRPRILIPAQDYTDAELEIIIAHETAHCKRRDMWYKLVLLAANAAHWFNPLVYVMVKCADRDLEYSCDDMAVKGKDADYRRMYSKVILKTIGRK